MSRAPVIPVASNSPSARESSASWMCMSQRPGMRNRSLPSITLADARETSSSESNGGDLVLLNDDVHVGQTNSPPDIDHSYIHDRNRCRRLVAGCTSSQCPKQEQ